MRYALTVLLVLLVPATSAAAKPRAGAPDRSFGGAGHVVLDLPGERMVPSAMAIQADGKIVVVGSLGDRRALAVRFLANGKLDRSFGSGGIARRALTLPVTVAGVAIQPDGRILLAGQAAQGDGLDSAAVIRLRADGSVDGTFGSKGMAVVEAFPGSTSTRFEQFTRLGIQPDGRIVAAGQMRALDPHDPTDLIVARLRPDGQPDPSFDGDGVWHSHLDYAVRVLSHPDGHMIVVGWQSLYFGGASMFALRFSTGPAVLPPMAQRSPDIGTYEFNGGVAAHGAGIRADGSIVIAGGLNTNDSQGLRWVRISADLRELDRRAVDGIGVKAVAFDSRDALLTVGLPREYFRAPPFGVRRYRGARLRRDYSLGRRRGRSRPLLDEPGIVIGAEVHEDKLVVAATTDFLPDVDKHPLVVARLRAHQDSAGPVVTVHGLPTRRCVQGVAHPLVRVRDESGVRMEVRVDRRALRRSRRKRIRLNMDTRRLAPGPHKLIVTARDAAGNLGGGGSSFSVCRRG
jgi:uncharacterized delta-60 repeat protein